MCLHTSNSHDILIMLHAILLTRPKTPIEMEWIWDIVKCATIRAKIKIRTKIEYRTFEYIRWFNIIIKRIQTHSKNWSEYDKRKDPCKLYEKRIKSRC